MQSIINFSLKTLILCGITSYTLFGQPKLHIVGGTQIDFGNIPSFKPTKHTIKIKNLGIDTLILSNISTSCGCTATLLSNDHIAPNDSSNLYVTFDAKRFNGQVHKMISMVTNDSTNQNVSISFIANVVNVFELVPEYFFIRSNTDSVKTQTLTIKNISTQPIKFLSVVSTSSSLIPTLSTDEIKPNETTTLTVSFVSKSHGTFNGNINIKTTHQNATSLDIRFFALVTDKGK